MCATTDDDLGFYGYGSEPDCESLDREPVVRGPFDFVILKWQRGDRANVGGSYGGWCGSHTRELMTQRKRSNSNMVVLRKPTDDNKNDNNDDDDDDDAPPSNRFSYIMEDLDNNNDDDDDKKTRTRMGYETEDEELDFAGI